MVQPEILNKMTLEELQQVVIKQQEYISKLERFSYANQDLADSWHGLYTCLERSFACMIDADASKEQYVEYMNSLERKYN